MTKLLKVSEHMKKNGFDAVLVYNELNQRYITDFSFTDGVVVITLSSAYLVTDFRYFEMANNKASADFEKVMYERIFWIRI